MDDLLRVFEGYIQTILKSLKRNILSKYYMPFCLISEIIHPR